MAGGSSTIFGGTAGAASLGGAGLTASCAQAQARIVSSASVRGISIPSASLGQLRRDLAQQRALREGGLVHIAVGVGLVFAQIVLRPERPFRVRARPQARIDGLVESLGGLVFERQRLRLESAAIELALLGVQPARHRRIQQSLVEIAVGLADAGEGRLAPLRAPDPDQLRVLLEQFAQPRVLRLERGDELALAGMVEMDGDEFIESGLDPEKARVRGRVDQRRLSLGAGKAAKAMRDIGQESADLVLFELAQRQGLLVAGEQELPGRRRPAPSLLVGRPMLRRLPPVALPLEDETDAEGDLRRVRSRAVPLEIFLPVGESAGIVAQLFTMEGCIEEPVGRLVVPRP